MRTVLVTGIDGGAAQSILRCLRKARRYRVIVTGIDPLCIGLYRGDKGYLVSKDWEEFKKQIEKICKKEKVDIIIPGSDIELTHFVKNREWYEENCPPILIDWKNIPLARDKYLLQKKLKELGFPYIETWKEDEFDKIDLYPIVLKPRHGFGSRMLFKGVEKEHLEGLVKYMKHWRYQPIAQKQVFGDEYSCMTLRAKDGELLCYFIAWSFKKFGQSYKTIVKKDEPEIKELIISLGEKLKSVGPLSFQLIRDIEDNKLKIFELNARFTGAQIVRAYGGMNMVDLAVRNWLDGKKEYPRLKKEYVAFWYHDFGYSPIEVVENLKRTGVTKKKVKLPKYL